MDVTLRKIISAAAAAALFITAAAMPAVAEAEKVTLIVETEGDPLLAAKNAAQMGASAYMKTAEAKKEETRILSAQSEVKSDIKKRVRADVNSGYTYTSVINGFSMEAYESDIEKIKAVDGVKNVYISEKFEIPTEPASNSESEPGFGAQMMNTQAMYDAGFDGRGQAIAIIDAAFDTSHEFFASGVAEPRLTKSSIKEFIENNELNADISVNQVYRSEKIPFAYDYGEGDADTYDASVIHGSHVAGIAAGKNGVMNGITFSGVAPEAQLVLMKVADKDGGMSFSTIIKAMDDASKMSVCAVNMSIGSTRSENALMYEASENMRNTGIALISSAGNSDRHPETADHPDYIYSNMPACFEPVTSVASIDADKLWVFSGIITLGSGEQAHSSYNELFFKKFSDKPYDYVCGETLADFQTMGDIAGKIAIVPEETDAKSAKLIEMGVVGLILVSPDENVGVVSTVSDEIPGIMVSKSVGEKLINAETKTIQTIEEENVSIEESQANMAYYTSWGTGADLELKPEITAPGTDILSAGNDDEYINDTGTSMASPQITGAMALMTAFTDKAYPDVTGADKVALMENILMSSASIVFQDEEKTLPESPRHQGAGLANLEDALTLPVILKGDTGKSKLSLKDELNDNITLTFKAQNLTEQPITYDDIKIYAFTDNYEEKDGKNMITDSVPLNFEPAGDNPASVTIPANEEEEITLKITLDSAQTAANKEIFTNGFWIDGYAVLSSKDGKTTKASIPYTGFYGDWTAFDAMTPSYFEDGGSAENGGLMMKRNDNNIMLGTNMFVDKNAADRSEYESEDYVGFSYSYADNYYIYMRVLRSMTDVRKTYRNSDGEITSEETEGLTLTRKDSVDNYLDSFRTGPYDDTEGERYSVTISGRLAYESERSLTEEKTFKYYVDSTPPEIKDPKIYEDGGKTYAEFEASDNFYLMGAAAHDESGKTVTEPIKAEKQADIKLDITDMDTNTLEFSVADYAYNENVFKIGTVSAEITDSIMVGSSAVFIANVKNTAADTEADVVTALYDGNGRLIGTDMESVTLGSGAEIPLTFSFTDAKGASKAKMFVWKHSEIIPLTDAAEIDL